MERPRFRLFAGPNGSGKTYIFNEFKTRQLIHTELYINADRFETELRKRRKFFFNAYRVKVDEDEFRKYIRNSSLSDKIGDDHFSEHLSIRGGILRVKQSFKINSYHASFVASYLAEKLLESNQSFAFETVMSHPSKIDLLRLAKEKGYKTYLYFLFAEDPDINILRIKLRIKAGGHDVKPGTVRNRIPRTIGLLPIAFKTADSAYLINNSNTPQLILKKEKDVLYKSNHFPDLIKTAARRIITDFKGKKLPI